MVCHSVVTRSKVARFSQTPLGKLQFATSLKPPETAELGSLEYERFPHVYQSDGEEVAEGVEGDERGVKVRGDRLTLRFLLQSCI